MPIEAKALTTTLYCRSDTQTVNTIFGYILSDTNSSSSDSFYAYSTRNTSSTIVSHGYTNANVAIIHADGSSTVLATAIAQTDRASSSNMDESVVESVSWSCPDTTLVPTDALQITWHAETFMPDAAAGNTDRLFITVPLNWSKLNSATWTLYRYRRYRRLNTGNEREVWSYIYHGDSTYTTYITGIDYTLAQKGYAFLL